MLICESSKSSYEGGSKSVMLTLNNVTKKYKDFTAVKDINLELKQGLYGLLAPNGAGKTTLIKMITTLLFPTKGEILYNGREIRQMGAEYRDLIGYLPQQFGYYKNNTPEQYLWYLSALKGLSEKEAKERTDHLLHMVGLSEVKKKKMKKFSGGMLQRVGIAQAMLNDPAILVLDEPTAGLDPKERVRFRNIISSLSKDRIVILSTHIVSDIESIANEVILIKDKRLYCKDTVQNICERFEGKIYETVVANEEFEQFEEEYQVLSIRQEYGHTVVRFFSREKIKDCETKMPNLEDVFLCVYQEDEKNEVNME